MCNSGSCKLRVAPCHDENSVSYTYVMLFIHLIGTGLILRSGNLRSVMYVPPKNPPTPISSSQYGTTPTYHAYQPYGAVGKNPDDCLQKWQRLYVAEVTQLVRDNSTRRAHVLCHRGYTSPHMYNTKIVLDG